MKHKAVYLEIIYWLIVIAIVVGIVLLSADCSPYYAAGSNYTNYAPYVTVYNAWGATVYQDYGVYEVRDGDLIVNGRPVW